VRHGLSNLVQRGRRATLASDYYRQRAGEHDERSQ